MKERLKIPWTLFECVCLSSQTRISLQGFVVIKVIFWSVVLHCCSCRAAPSTWSLRSLTATTLPYWRGWQGHVAIPGQLLYLDEIAVYDVALGIGVHVSTCGELRCCKQIHSCFVYTAIDITSYILWIENLFLHLVKATTNSNTIDKKKFYTIKKIVFSKIKKIYI